MPGLYDNVKKTLGAAFSQLTSVLGPLPRTTQSQQTIPGATATPDALAGQGFLQSITAAFSKLPSLLMGGWADRPQFSGPRTTTAPPVPSTSIQPGTQQQTVTPPPLPPWVLPANQPHGNLYGLSGPQFQQQSSLSGMTKPAEPPWATYAPGFFQSLTNQLKSGTALPGGVGLDQNKLGASIGGAMSSVLGKGFGDNAGNVGKGLENASNLTGQGPGLMGDVGKVLSTGGKVARAVEGDPTAYVELAVDAAKEGYERAQAVMMRLGQAGQRYGNMIQSEHAGDIVSNFAGAQQEQVGAVQEAMGPLKWLVPQLELIKGTWKLIEVFGGAVERLRGFNEGLHRANMQFAEFSAAMALVEVRQEMRDIQFGRERGDRRAATAEHLATSKSTLDRQLAPLEDKWANFKNELFSKITMGLTVLIEFAKIGSPLLNFLLKDDGKEGADFRKATFAQGQDWFQKHGQPQRFNR